MRLGRGAALAALAALLLCPPAPSVQDGGVEVAAAGDVACDPDHRPGPGECADADTARLLEGADLVLTLGDGQYPDGALDRYQRGYGRTWGRYLDRTRPVPGNHDYGTPQARGYFAYFGDRAGPPGAGYYAFRVPGWLLLALNSNCWAAGGCGPGSPQYRWLADRLAAAAGACVLAYWHHPTYSAGRYTGQPELLAWWDLLYRRGPALVLVGHDHNYQRFASLEPTGRPDPGGVRQFVVGTGGKNLYRARHTGPVRPEVVRDDRFGVLRLRLLRGRYAWRFVTTGGEEVDRGESGCR